MKKLLAGFLVAGSLVCSYAIACCDCFGNDNGQCICDNGICSDQSPVMSPDVMDKVAAAKRIAKAFKEAALCPAFQQAQLLAKVEAARAFGILIVHVKEKLAVADQAIVRDILSAIEDFMVTADFYLAQVLEIDPFNKQDTEKLAEISNNVMKDLRPKIQRIQALSDPFKLYYGSQEGSIESMRNAALLLQDLMKTIAMGCDVGIAELA